MQTANQLRGRAIGAAFLIGFGALWLLEGLYNCRQLTAASTAWIIGGMFLLGSLCASVLRRTESSTPDRSGTKRNRAFHRINGV